MTLWILFSVCFNACHPATFTPITVTNTLHDCREYVKYHDVPSSVCMRAELVRP